jgi:hypothetical protein
MEVVQAATEPSGGSGNIQRGEMFPGLQDRSAIGVVHRNEHGDRSSTVGVKMIELL